jgi:hypothetical protein
MFCTGCGSSLTPEARFCVSCGQAIQQQASPSPVDAVRATVVPPQPPNTSSTDTPISAPDPAGVAPAAVVNPVVLPRWASLDWLQAAIGALAIIVGVVLISAVVRLLLGISEGFDGPVFQQIMLLASLALGANVGETGDYGEFRLALIAVPFVLVTMVAARLVADRVTAPIAGDRPRFISYAAKTALLASLLSIAIGSLASIQFSNEFEEESSFTVATGKGFLMSFVLVLIGTLLTRNRHRTRKLSRFTEMLGEPVRIAITAYALVAAITFLVGFVYAITQIDDLSFKDLLNLVLVALIGGGTIAGGTASFGMGAPVKVQAIGAADFAESGSAHLFTEGVPLWVKFGLIVAPLVIAALTWRHLLRRRPTSQQELVRLATLTGAAFGIVSMLAASISGITLSAFGSSFVDAVVDSGELQLSYNIGLVLILGLLWGWVGSFIAAALWGNQNGMPIIVTTPTPTP